MHSPTPLTTKEHHDSRIVTEYLSPAAFDRLLQEWNHLHSLSASSSPFTTCLWQKLWWTHHHHHRILRIITVRRKNGALCGIAPLYQEENYSAVKLQLLGSTDLCDYLDCIVTPGEEEYFYHTLCTYLASSFTVPLTLCLNSLPPLASAIRHLPKIVSRIGHTIALTQEDTAPSLALPSTFESYLHSLDQKNRHELRRKMGRAERTTKVSFTRIDQPSQLLSTLPHFFHLFRTSRGDKDAFLTPSRKSFFITMAEEFSSRGWCELYALSYDTKEVAYLLCFNYHDTLYLYNAAYDITYATLSPGIVALVYCLRDAINRGLKRFDFMRGGEAYKYHFGAQDHPLTSLTLQLPGEKVCTALP